MKTKKDNNEKFQLGLKNSEVFTGQAGPTNEAAWLTGKQGCTLGAEEL
jgi:hypothetical protein